MQSKNKIYAFFVVAALIFWNPLSFYFVYGDTAAYTFKLIHFFFWFVFLLGCLIVFLLLKKKPGPVLSNTIFLFSVAGILFSLIVLVNVLIGLSGPGGKPSQVKRDGLLFMPGSKIHNHTVEFDYVVDINSIGLRDREFATDKGNNYRIVCFGDSWTYGWGVNIENTWPKKLELYLKLKGIENVEVINCGKPGAYTSTYKKDIEKIIPLLKPDMVLLGVLQLDDLAQLYERIYPLSFQKQKITFIKKVKKAGETFFTSSFNNIMSSKKAIFSEVDMKKDRLKAVSEAINNLSPDQESYYNALDDSVKNLLQNGNLSPSSLFYSAYRHDRVKIFNDPDQEATRLGIAEMNKDLEAIKSVCSKYNSRILFITLPNHFFTGHRVVIGRSDTLNSYFENNNKIDSIYRAIAFKNSLAYFEMTKDFRELKDKSAYFFKYDGHPTQSGHDEIARLIADYLVNSKWKR